MKHLLITVFILLSVSAFSQQATEAAKPRWKYTGIVQGGLIGGSSELNYCAQTLQGVQKGPWMLGLGVGFDDYVVPGFPIVAHGQFNYGKKRSKPFVYAQAGAQIPWKKNGWDEKILDIDRYEMKTGWLAEGGVGYSFPMGKRLKLLSSLGYSIKQAQYDEAQIPWSWLISSRWPPAGTTPDFDYYHHKLTMNRLVLKIGIQF